VAVRIVTVVLGFVAVLFGGYTFLLRDSSAYGDENRHVTGDFKVGVPGLGGITLKHGSLYPPHDPWKRYLADEKTCPNAEKTDRPLSEQANTMVCLVNFARVTRGLEPLTTVPLLNETSLAKATRIERCQEFAHTPCGEPADVDARKAGYRGSFGENLYVANGALAAPRLALDSWLNSPGHRRNLFDAGWKTQGIAVLVMPTFGKDKNSTLWVNQFGDF
jgi:uncharacterized protein YkwD